MQPEQRGTPPPLGRGGQQQRGGGQEAGRGKPKPTKEVQLWDAIVAAAAKQERRSQHQSQQHTRPKQLRPGERPASAPARQQPLKPVAAAPPGTTLPPSVASPAPWAHWTARPRAADAQPSPPPAAAPMVVASPAPPKSGKAATAATTATTKSKGAGGAPRKAKHHHPQQQRQQNTNWASNQRHIAFRGKERETPKPTKPSKLKRVILLERAKADALHQPPPPPTPVQPGTPPPGDNEPEEHEEHEQEGIDATHEAHGRDEPCLPVPGLPSQIDHHHGDGIGDEAASGEQTQEVDGGGDVRGGGGGSFTDTEVAPLAPPAAAPAEIDHHHDYDSPPPSPPPGAAEVQSIDATYCKQVISVELNQVMRQLLQELTRFQERARTKNPDKARSNKKRYVCGLREVLRSVERRKARCVVVTPNIERISSPEGGLFEAVEAIVRTSQQHRIIVIFAMTRTSLGKAISKRLKIAALAILDPSGAEEHYKQALALAHKGRLDYRRMHKRKSQQHNIPKPLPPSSGQPSKAGQPQPPLEHVLPQLIQQVIDERLRTEPLVDDAT